MESLKHYYQKYKEMVNYLFFGVCATGVNFITYFLAARLLGIDEVISNILSWLVSVLFAYVTNRIFVFESKTKGVKAILKEMTSFILARIVTGALCDVGTFTIMVKVWHIHDVIAKIVTQIMVVITNYLFSKLLIFKHKKENINQEAKGEK